jgi:RHS repeat-associated protein
MKFSGIFQSHPLGQSSEHYELGNHLGNVLAVVTHNIHMADDLTTTAVASASDYYPFGLQMDSRTVNDGDYRYGFNGKEKDDKGEFGNTHYDYGFRIYNPAIAKFLSVDPLTKSYPMLTPYQFASNTPIQAIDLDGLEAFFIHGTNHGPDVWDAELLVATQEVLFNITNNVTPDNNFSWRVRSTQTKKSFWRGKTVPRTDKFLNHQTNDLVDRQEAAGLLVDYVLNSRRNSDVNEEVTLIGYSHGGNVAILAAQILFDEHNISSNIITINTPAYNSEGNPQNPLENTGINDMVAFWTYGDWVAGGLAGSDSAPENDGDDNTPRIRVFELSNREEVGGLYNDHFLENVDPESIEGHNVEKLNPVPNERR